MNVQLYRFNGYLKSFHPDLWIEHGFGNSNVSFAVKLMRLRRFAREYESDNAELNRQFASIRFIYRLSFMSLAVVMLGITMLLL